jgi:Raf kinase inhibitor-like YbhB/YbcL family protein
MPFRLSSAAFQHGARMPQEFTCDGPDNSPSLSWTEPPAKTLSFALIVDDPDAPSGLWVHWVLYDLPANTLALPQAVAKDRQLPNGARQGRNDFGKIGYNGPCPPRGGPHRYFFKLYALDAKTNLKSGATKSELERAIKGHVLAKAELVGRFQR